MSYFDPWAESELHFTPLPDRRVRLTESYTVYVPAIMFPEKGGLYVIVPRGFESDGSSVPRLFWIWAPPMSGAYLPAAVVHDWFYRGGAEEVGEDRKGADTIFYYHMIAAGVRTTQARIKYRAVRMFGWIPWRRNRRAA